MYSSYMLSFYLNSIQKASFYESIYQFREGVPQGAPTYSGHVWFKRGEGGKLRRQLEKRWKPSFLSKTVFLHMLLQYEFPKKYDNRVVQNIFINLMSRWRMISRGKRKFKNRGFHPLLYVWHLSMKMYLRNK